MPERPRREPFKPTELPDQSDAVVRLIAEAALGAEEGTIAYHLGRGINQVTERSSDIVAIQTAISVLTENGERRAETQLELRYESGLQRFPADVQNKIADLRIYLAPNGVRDEPTLWNYTNLKQNEVGAFVAIAGDYRTIVFTNPHTREIQSFSLITLPERTFARIGVFPYTQVEGTPTTSIIVPAPPKRPTPLPKRIRKT